VSRPGRGVVDEETCPIVRARGCSAGFIGTGVLSAAPPWRLAPLVLRPDVRLRPVTRGAQPVGLLDKAVKRTPLVLRRPEEDDEDNPPA
jgi:hypothetical protein